MTCGIYMITNKVNGKIYIGQAVDIEERWQSHKTELKGNYHHNKHLQNAWNKDGEDNFEFTIICECDESQLNTMEQYYIFDLMVYDDRIGYNKNYGGSSGRPTEESRKKMSKAKKGKYIGENHPFYGKHHSEETRKKISEAIEGKNHPNYGKHHSEETRKKISETEKGKTCSEESRKKMSEAKRGEKHPMYGKFGVKHNKSIPVVQLTLEGELVNVYGSSMDAARNGFNHGNINMCIKGKRKTHGGYKWCYLHEYISKMNPNIKTINLFGKTYEVNQEEVKIGQEG